MPGFSPSEWVDEKLSAARQLGHFVILVTAVSSQLKSCDHQVIIKLPSLSNEDFTQECSELQKTGEPKPSRGLVMQFAGRMFDRIFKALAGNRSDGRWSWALPATLVIWASTLKFRPDVIVATGGPSAAQFAASLATLFPGAKRPVLEFQDPFIGREMGLSDKVLRAMRILNSFMMRRSKKYVVVSNGSLQQVQDSYASHSSKIAAIYPFAEPRTGSNKLIRPSTSKGRVEFLHAGTLYGTRSLQPLFKALDAGYASGKFAPEHIQISNLGADYTGTEPRVDYRELDLLPRNAALERARHAQALLLVQHSDGRSLETIPFKLYDYLNLDVPIIVIGRNPEIRELLADGDFFCPLEDQQSLILAISGILNANLSSSGKQSSAVRISNRPSPDSFLKAWQELLA